VICADPAGGNNDGLGAQFELADHVPVGRCPTGSIVVREHHTADSGHRAVGEHQLVDAVAVVKAHQPVVGGGHRSVDERFDDPGAGAPRDVEAGDRVPVTGGAQIAAFSPPDGRQERHAVLGEVGAFVAGGELNVGAGPLGCPAVLVVKAVERRAARPVAPGQLE
jgi:hypothetical protein